MSKVTPPGPAAADRLTVKLNDVVPALPSLWETSLIVRLGTAAHAAGAHATIVSRRRDATPTAIAPRRRDLLSAVMWRGPLLRRTSARIHCASAEAGMEDRSARGRVGSAVEAARPTSPTGDTSRR